MKEIVKAGMDFISVIYPLAYATWPVSALVKLHYSNNFFSPSCFITK